MHSIRYRIAIPTVLAIIVSVLIIGLVGIISIKDIGDRSSGEILTLQCERAAQELDAYMNSVVQAVETVSRYTEKDLNDVNDTVELTDRQMHYHLIRVRDIFDTVARNTRGAMTYYYRIAPEVSGQEQGFWYSKFEQESFEAKTLTDLEAYDPDNVSRVGWYTIPKERGKASWLSPYFNENLEAWMISYVVPIYHEGEFIGVVGIDIDYETLASQLRTMVVLQNGYAFLTDENGKTVYHPQKEIGSDSVAFHKQEVQNALSERVALVDYQYEGEEKLAAACALSNEMRLYVTAPLSEINADWIRMVKIVLISAVLILLIFVTFSFLVTSRVTIPLRKLTEAARQLDKGNYEVKLDYAGDDEVGILTGTFNQLTGHLKENFNDLSSRAYKDALTNIRNKGAYDRFLLELREEIDQASRNEMPVPEFAICVFDCNDLKRINDRYGHEKGDLYLKASCDLICRTYRHSPVFRIGGDEFVAILQGPDLEEREKQQNSFQQQMAAAGNAPDPWRRVSMAVGLAIYDPKQDLSPGDTFKRADILMYENKRKMKNRKEQSDETG